MDEQHKNLIGIIDELAYLISSKDYGLMHLLEIICKLGDYTKEHLSFEEEIMRQNPYEI